MGACISKPNGNHNASDVVVVPKRPTLLSGKSPVYKEGGLCHGQFILEKSSRIQDVYTLERRKLGTGTYGSVSRGTHKATSAVRAVKTIAKGQMRNVERFKKEIAIMKQMDHPSIIKLFETFEDQRNIYLAMELCSGGELFDRILGTGHFNEGDAAIVMQQILCAVFYMHKHGVCHRDLKPENFLFMTKEDPISRNVLKLIDFGLSSVCADGQMLSTKAGTPYYVSPQVLSGKYDRQCDIWSCGVIMYILLCGYPPFYGQSDAEVLAKVRLGNVSFDPRDWKNVSEDARDLVKMMLKMNPHERYTGEEALNHSWIKHKAPRATNVSLQKGFVDNLRAFRSQNKLMKAALQIIAGQLSEDKIRALRQTFMALDCNSDGLLSVSELKEGLSRAGIEVLPQSLQEIMDGVDADGSGLIDYTEFLAATLERRQYLQEDVCWTAFKVFDLNDDGMITIEELKQVLANGYVEEAAGVEATAQVLQEVDKNGDGSIDFDEFMAMMKGRRSLK